MNVFRLPDRLCREIDAALAKFWWSTNWFRWDELGRAKGDGRMSFSNLKDFNSALLAKQCWQLLHELNLL
ncbi:hypothetical protein ACFX1T_025520 [Malus domestica]